MAKKTKTPKLAELPPQPDATAPVDSGTLLKAAQPLLKLLEADLLDRAKASAGVEHALKERHAAEKAARRTADAFPQWLARFVEQVAAAWFLSCVFVRTLEDRGLLGQNRIAGPGALDSQRLFLQLAPSLSERDYLLTVFRELTRLPAARGLFDAAHNPVWMLAPSAEGAKALLNLFRTPGADSPALRFGQADTRVLGDLYQDLNENVRKRYALLQTPDFVEEFILDRTLEPAIEKFGLEDTDLIDPTCGSGHFLLGAFERLYEHRLRAQPGLAPREAASLALDKVYGSDINPYAVAVARFRLTLAYLDKAGFDKVADAPELPLHVVVADSLLHNPQLEQTSFKDLDGQESKAWAGEEFALEDEAVAREVLHRRFAAVVGNPPYITVKDKVLRERYRDMYPSAAGQYAVSVPFTERFFQLGRPGARVGMITANSFMKREFGKKLIREYLPTVNLDVIVNTSGAYIPGHGTPTVLLFGSSEAPQADDVLAVLAKRGEPTTPTDPEQGHVWRSIADRFDEVGFENHYISVARLQRSDLIEHPWSLAGGGADELKKLLEARSSSRLTDLVLSIGRVAHTGNDEPFVVPRHVLEAVGLDREHITDFVEGNMLRDWTLVQPGASVFPYDEAIGFERCSEDPSDPRLKWLWPYRTMLWERREPNGTHREIGLTWYEFSRFHPERYEGMNIAFAFVATHNHFVLDRGGKVFKQSAPIIKLPETATEDDHLALLAYLNSSTACFWMKQVFFPKYGALKADHPDPARNFYEFASTALQELPLPLFGAFRSPLIRLASELTDIGQKRAVLLSSDNLARSVLSGGGGSDTVDRAWQEADELRRRAVAIQEEIDWIVYAAFGLAEPSGLETAGDYLATARLTRGQRAFENVESRRSLVRRSGELLLASEAEVETAPPTVLSEKQHSLLRRRVDQTRKSPELSLLESNVFKRLWRDTEANETELDYRKSHGKTVGRIAVQIGFEQELRERREPVNIDSSSQDSAQRIADEFELDLGQSIVDASVPYLQAWRLADSGIAKLADWCRVWDLQRREDAGEAVGEIPVPPKYAQKDFRDARYWGLRGKLDVPKERFISYPGCESDEDGEPVYGWAGWDHLQRAQALVALYQDRKDREGWEADRLTPMLAGVLELIPWLKQWHNDPSEEFDGLRMGDSYESFLDGECRQFGLTHDDLRAWRPATKKKGRKRSKKKA